MYTWDEHRRRHRDNVCHVHKSVLHADSHHVGAMAATPVYAAADSRCDADADDDDADAAAWRCHCCHV